MFTKYDKAIASFVLTFVSALVAEVQAGAELTLKTLLLALGSAIVASGAVYQTRNKGN